jgi:tRNA(Ile)-lysidine synthase
VKSPSPVTLRATRIGEYVSEVPTQSEALESVHGSLAALPPGRWLLAVSGGRDSMALLEAFATARTHEVAGVASFDHGTGPAARRAVALVERSALALQLPAMTGALPAGAATDEAAWRAARWRFLRGWAAELRASVVTAHTNDDQVETVVLRLLRGSGVRGLAAMRVAERGGVVRPFLGLPRATIAAYAAARRVKWIEDPSNASRAFARNRVRHELLPALERASPGFADWCWDLSGRAAGWRADLAAWVDAVLAPAAADATSVVVPAAPVAALAAEAAAIVWPELAARVGLALDRRGIARLVAWAPRSTAGGRVPLAGGGDVRRTARTFVVRRVY